MSVKTERMKFSFLYILYHKKGKQSIGYSAFLSAIELPRIPACPPEDADSSNHLSVGFSAAQSVQNAESSRNASFGELSAQDLVNVIETDSERIRADAYACVDALFSELYTETDNVPGANTEADSEVETDAADIMRMIEEDVSLDDLDLDARAADDGASEDDTVFHITQEMMDELQDRHTSKNTEMRTVSYSAVFEPSGDGYSVYFPDLPGCVAFGDSFEDAREDAADALWLHLHGMQEDGEMIPAPSQNPHVDKDTAPGYLVSHISVRLGG